MINYVNVHMFGGVGNVAGTVANDGTIVAGTQQVLAFDVPSDDLGGGFSIVSCTAHATGTIAAASAPQFDVVALSESGGTVSATICAFGSVAYVPGVPKVGTLSTTWIDQDAGYYYVGIVHKQTAVLAPGTVGCWISIGYTSGR